MDKVKSRRLKKLRQRADSNCISKTNTSRSSGLHTFADADELQALMKLQAEHKRQLEEGSSTNEIESPFSALGTSLHVVKDCTTEERIDPDQWKVVDVTAHRDLIASLLLHCGNEPTVGQKRERDSTIPTVSIPNWVRVHNPALLRNLAVIEFNIDTYSDEIGQSPIPADRDQSLDIMPSTRLRKEMAQSKEDTQHSYSTITKLLMGNDHVGRNILPFKTQIQGQPKHVTEVLMYVSDTNESEVKKTNCSDDGCNSAPKSPVTSSNIIENMHKLLLTQKDLMNEGFPCPKDASSSSLFDTKLETFQRLVNISSTWDQNATVDLHESVPFQGQDSLQIVRDLAVEIDDDPNFVNEPDGSSSHPKLYISSCLSREGGSTVAKAFAVDCEMVETIHGLELARVTVLRFDPSEDHPDHYRKMLDSLVKPAAKIIDYKTEYSGITAKMLLNVTTKIEDIQASLASLICKQDIIIGHSLENDLSVLRFLHANIVDTAVLFRGEDNRKMSLRYLSKVLLHKQIQTTSGSLGHDSVEDAAASLFLAIQRARTGPSFRLKRKDAGKINIVDLVQKKSHQDRVCSRIRNQGILACIGPNDWIHQHVGRHSSAHALSCETIENSTVNALSTWLKSSHRKTSIIWANLVVDGANAHSSNRKIDTVLDKVLADSPLDTLFLVLFQRGSQFAETMSKQRKVAKNPRSTLGWTSVQENEFNRHIEVSQWAEAFWICKSR